MSDQRFMQRDTTENPFPSVGKTIVIHGLSSKPKLAFGSQSSSQRSDRRPLDTERVRWGVERMGLDGFCIETGINSCKSTEFMQTVPSTILSMRRNTFPAQKYLSSTPKLALAAKERISEIFSPESILRAAANIGERAANIDWRCSVASMGPKPTTEHNKSIFAALSPTFAARFP